MNQDKPYLIESPIQKVICEYKFVKHFDRDDRTWDKLNWSRSAKAAKNLIEIFNNDYESAMKYVNVKGKYFDSKNLNWTIETLCRYALEDLNKIKAFNAIEDKKEKWRKNGLSLCHGAKYEIFHDGIERCSECLMSK